MRPGCLVAVARAIEVSQDSAGLGEGKKTIFQEPKREGKTGGDPAGGHES